MRQLIVSIFVAAVILVALSSSASAFTMQERIVVANEQVAIVRVPAGGFTAQERVDRVNERLAYILGFEPLNPGAIRAVGTGSTRTIMVGDTPLVTVTPRDADANNTTVVGLTQVWVQLAREALPQARPTPSVPG